MANKWSEEDTETWYKKWNTVGGTVVRLNEKERKATLDKLRPLGDKIFMNDPKVAPMYKLFKAAAAMTR